MVSPLENFKKRNTYFNNMKIGKTFGITKEEIKEKKFNILIPICLGNRFFLNDVDPTDNTSTYIDWALKYTKERILILIVDEIQITNWNVRNSNISSEQNMRRLMKKGEAIQEKFQELVQELPKNEQERIEILRWEDYYKKDPFCKETTNIVYTEFKNNDEFQKKVLESVKKSITDRKFDEESYITLCNYVLDEFSLVYHGVKYDGTYFGLLIYPGSDDVLELVEDIKSGAMFLELSKKLNDQKIAVVLMK